MEMLSEEQTCHLPKAGGGLDFFTTGNPIKAASNTKASNNSFIAHQLHISVQVLGNESHGQDQ